MLELRSNARWKLAAHSGGLVLGLLVSCAPELPSGRFSCTTDDDCPGGWTCAANVNGESRCFPTDTDGRAIRGTNQPDSGRPDAGPTDPPEPPPLPREDSGVTPGEAGTRAPAAGSGGSQPPAAGAGGKAPPVAGATPPPPTQCKADAPDAQKGVFVSPTGSAAADCGSAAKPCASIEHAFQRAVSDDRKFIYLERGRYPESPVLRAGLRVEGGFEHDAGRWTRDCSADRAARTTIESPIEIGVLAEYDGDAALEALTISTTASVAAGHSTYGIFARGSATRLRLRDVRVIAAAGGNGRPGDVGETPAPRTGSCVPGSDGADGATEGTPGSGATAGMFDSSGFVPGDGTAGGDGVSGHNGATGTQTCLDCRDSCDPATCTGNIVGQSCGFPGAAGCGGAAAAGGGGGGGGGSSFALFAWGARVEVEAGLLQAGDGGLGGAGGEPGQGGLGSEGALGANGETCLVCKRALIPIDPIDPPVPSDSTNVQASELPPADAAEKARILPDAGIIAPIGCAETKGFGIGGAGTRGGKGSRGGRGGDGAGGHSYGALAGGQAIVDISNTTRIEIGQPGRSADNGEAGLAAEIKLLR